MTLQPLKERRGWGKTVWGRGGFAWWQLWLWGGFSCYMSKQELDIRILFFYPFDVQSSNHNPKYFKSSQFVILLYYFSMFISLSLSSPP